MMIAKGNGTLVVSAHATPNNHRRERGAFRVSSHSAYLCTSYTQSTSQ